MEFAGLKLQQCRHGWMLCDGPVIGKCLELYGEYSEGEVDCMRRYVRPGDTVVDVGANIGSLTLPLAHMVGEAGSVYAIESRPENFNLLCANLALNALQQVRPLNVFVRADPGFGTDGLFGHSFVGNRWPPTFMALDDLGLEACALIKIDVDGGELQVLRSGAQLIRRTRPVLYFENDQKEKSRPLLQHAMDLGYELYWHFAPFFRPDNFRGNPQNVWAPRHMVSPMVLGLPSEKAFAIPDLDLIADTGEWRLL
jgi:hypothetical protein